MLRRFRKLSLVTFKAQRSFPQRKKYSLASCTMMKDRKKFSSLLKKVGSFSEKSRIVPKSTLICPLHLEVPNQTSLFTTRPNGKYFPPALLAKSGERKNDWNIRSKNFSFEKKKRFLLYKKYWSQKSDRFLMFKNFVLHIFVSIEE